MKYFVEYGYIYEEFNTYREAEIFCGENGIYCENIYEENYAPDGTVQIVFAIEEKYQHRFKEFLQ